MPYQSQLPAGSHYSKCGGFEWDPNKYLSNLEKHKIDFEGILPLFETVHISKPSDNAVELRFISIGEIDGRVVVVIHTERRGHKRIISARKASQNEQNIYREHLKIAQR